VGFEEDGLNIRRDGVLTIRQGIEIAVRAFTDTERNVDVKTSHATPPQN
jgi:DNA-binding FadR family transcriptional regulator